MCTNNTARRQSSTMVAVVEEEEEDYEMEQASSPLPIVPSSNTTSIDFNKQDTDQYRGKKKRRDADGETKITRAREHLYL